MGFRQPGPASPGGNADRSSWRCMTVVLLIKRRNLGHCLRHCLLKACLRYAITNHWVRDLICFAQRASITAQRLRTPTAWPSQRAGARLVSDGRHGGRCEWHAHWAAVELRTVFSQRSHGETAIAGDAILQARLLWRSKLTRSSQNQMGSCTSTRRVALDLCYNIMKFAHARCTVLWKIDRLRRCIIILGLEHDGH